MSEVSSTIKISDGMSPALKSMNKALNIVLASFESLQAASGNSIDTSSIRTARTELANAAVAVNNLENELVEAENKQRNMTKEVNKTGTAMTDLVKRAVGLVTAYASLKSIVGLSDSLSQTKSRIGLIVDDEGTVAEVEAKIMASANRSGAAYLDTADAISKMALRAGDAFSKAGKVDMNQVISFTETLNKMYSIAGASAEEQTSSMLQLTQALGSGVLRGEEFNAVFEAAPNIMKAVADYMDVPIGKLRDMAADGEITAEVVKNAIFDASEQVNADFNNMSMTWQSLMNVIKNHALEASDGILEKINELANNTDVQIFLTGLADAVSIAAAFILGAFEVIASIAGFVYNNWSIIAPVIYAVVAALLIYYAALLIVKAQEIAVAAWGAIVTFGKLMMAAATWALTGATWAETTAQYGLNAAMYACPIVWIIVLFIALISVIFLVVAAINHFAGTSYSAIGFIAGSVMWLVALIYNTCVGVLNAMIQVVWSIFVDPFIGIIEWCLNAANGGFNSFGGAVANLIGQIISWFLSLGKIVTKIIDAIFGTDWTGGLNSLQDSVLAWGKSEEKGITLERKAPEIKRMDMTDAYSKGYDWGKGVGGKIKNTFSMPEAKTPKTPTMPEMPSVPDYSSIAPKVPNDTAGKVGKGTSGAGAGTDDLSNRVGKIADDTGKINGNLEISEEDVKYLRDIAEKEAINRFTTAEIKIDMGGINNTVNERSDLDGIVGYLEEKLYESMSIAAEGI